MGKNKQRRWVSHQLLVAALRRCMYESGEDVTDTDAGAPGADAPRPTCWQRLQRNAAAYEAFRKGKEDALLGAPQPGRKTARGPTVLSDAGEESGGETAGKNGEKERGGEQAREDERLLMRLARKAEQDRRRRQQKLRQNRHQQRQLLTLIREQKLGGEDGETEGERGPRAEAGTVGGAPEEDTSLLSSLEEQQALLRYLRRQEEHLIEEILRNQERAEDLARGVRTLREGAAARRRGQLRPSLQLLRGIRVSFRHVKSFLADSEHHQNFLRSFEAQLLRAWGVLWVVAETDPRDAAPSPREAGKDVKEESEDGEAHAHSRQIKREVEAESDAADGLPTRVAADTPSEAKEETEKEKAEMEKEEIEKAEREEGKQLNAWGGVRVMMFRVRKAAASQDGNWGNCLVEVGVDDLTVAEDSTLREFLEERQKTFRFRADTDEARLDASEESANSPCPSPPESPGACLNTEPNAAPAEKLSPVQRRDGVLVVWGLDGLQRKLVHGFVALVDDVVSCSVQVKEVGDAGLAPGDETLAHSKRDAQAKKKSARGDEKAVIVLLRGAGGARDACLSGPPLFSPAAELLAAIGVPTKRGRPKA